MSDEFDCQPNLKYIQEIMDTTPLYTEVYSTQWGIWRDDPWHDEGGEA